MITVARRRQADKLAEAPRSYERQHLSARDGHLAWLGGPVVGVVIALWLTAGVWGGRPPVGADTLGHLVLAEFSADHIFGEWQLDGWQPRFDLGSETFLFLSPGFFWAVGLVKLLSLGLLSATSAFKAIVVASFVVLPLAVAFLARSFGLGRREAGIAAILALAVNSPYGGVGLEGLFGSGLVIEQFGAIFFFLALGSIVRLVADPGPRWTIFAALSLAALLIGHTSSVTVLGVMLLVLFATVRLSRAASALGLTRWGPSRGEGERTESASQATGPAVTPRFSGRVFRYLVASAALAFALAGFHILPLIAHDDLQGPLTAFDTPPLGERLGAILQGELLFHPFVAIAVVAGWGFALAGIRKYRPYLVALAVTPLVYVAVAHGAVRLWPGNAAVLQLLERGLGYAGVLSVLPLAVLLARMGSGSGWRGDAGTLALAAALVIIPMGSAKDVARQMPDPTPQMHQAAHQLSRLVPDHARFATDRDLSGETSLTSVPNSSHWLAWASGRNTLSNFGMESSPAAEPRLEPEGFADEPADVVAETLSRLGVTHILTMSDQSAARLGSSRRLSEVWRSSPLAIFAVSPGSGQPDPADLVTFDAPGDAQLVGAEPNHIAIQMEPSRPTRATLPIGWSPKWHALLDGEPVDLRTASNGSIELHVPTDSARLILEFVPDRWDRLGGVMTLATLILLVRRWRESGRWPLSLRRRTSVPGPRADEDLHEVSATSAPRALPSGAEGVAQTLLGAVDVPPADELVSARDGDVPSRAERVAQALLAALDGSPRTERVPARDDPGDGPEARRDDADLTS